MRTTAFAIIFAVFAMNLMQFAYEIQHEAVAVNIQVPVRVYKGDTFISTLNIEDFKVYEDRILQKVEAVYLVRGTEIKREEVIGFKEAENIKTIVSRHFVLCFILSEYLSRVNGAVNYLFDHVVQKGDSLTVITPINTYNLKQQMLEKIPVKDLKQQLLGLLRKDLQIGNFEYRDVIRELERSASNQSAEEFEMALQQLEQLRFIDQNRLNEFARFLKSKKGQKYVYIFYQQESIPLLESTVIEGVDPSRPGSMKTATFFMDIVGKGLSLKTDIVKKAFSDSSTCVHFLYITKDIIDLLEGGRRGSLGGMRFIEKSGVIFSAFKEIAQATGGLTDVTANISYAFRKAVEASENYYLLFYSPREYRSDGKFRTIEVKIKGGGYRVLHRAGYVAD